jgi:hypothetical protein
MTVLTDDASASVDDIELRQSACARVARVSNQEINAAWQGGNLPYHKDREGFRASHLSDALVWIRRRNVSVSA